MRKHVQAMLVLILTAAALHSAWGIDFPTPAELVTSIGNYSQPSDMRKARYLTVSGESMEMLAGMPFEQYTALEAVMIEFTENPESSDEARERVIAGIERKLPVLSGLRRCNSLKYLVLHTGEFLFIRAADGIRYNNGDPASRSKADRLNLERLNARFGAKLARILPGIKVYAHTWGW